MLLFKTDVHAHCRRQQVSRSQCSHRPVSKGGLCHKLVWASPARGPVWDTHIGRHWCVACPRRVLEGAVFGVQVSRVKKLPIPAESTQLLGTEFVGEEGRGANLIDLFGGAVEVPTHAPARAARVGHDVGHPGVLATKWAVEPRNLALPAGSRPALACTPSEAIHVCVRLSLESRNCMRWCSEDRENSACIESAVNPSNGKCVCF